MIEPELFQRHRVLAWAGVVALFVLATAAAIVNGNWIEEQGAAERRHAAVAEAARLKADFQAHQGSIDAAIRAALAEGRMDDANALLRKYRPVANGALDGFSALYESQRLAAVRK